jgi:Zn-dependent peptidase ImmA (M78 family)
VAPSADTITVNPDVLRWARETAGFSVDHAAAKLQRDAALIERLERGEEAPSVGVLKKLAQNYKRSLATLLLPEPPPTPPLPMDFRTVKGKEGQRLSPPTLLALRKARRLQALAAELVEDDEQLQASFATGVYNATADPAMAAAKERRRLGIDAVAQLTWNDGYAAFRSWRAAVEEQGILVFQFRMPLEEVRGFSLAEGGPPTIVLNRSDSPIEARIFTLFHEYGHLLLGSGGICLAEAGGLLHGGQDNRDEQFCNRFAAALLVPHDALVQDAAAVALAKVHGVPTDELFNPLVGHFKVTRRVLLLRLYEARMLNREQVDAKWSEWDRQLLRPKETAKKRGRAGERRAKRCVTEFGTRLPSLVLNAEVSGRLSTADALDYLSIQLDDRKEVAGLLAGSE